MVSAGDVACAPFQGMELMSPSTPLGMLGSNWVFLSMLAMLVSLLALTLAYMIANFFRNQQLLAWAKFELYQVLMTAVVIAFAFLVIPGMCNFKMDFLDARYAGKSMYQIADDYFSAVESFGYLVFGYILYVASIFGYVAKITMFSSPIGQGTTENPLESMASFNNMMFMMTSVFSTAFLLLQLQMRILEYLAFACVGYLLPFGALLRSFEPTRGFGGTLLGMALVFMLFYPIIVVMNDYIVFSPLNEMRLDMQGALQEASRQADPATGTAPTATNSGGTASGMEGVRDPSNDNENLYTFSSGITGGTLYVLRPILIYVVAAVFLPVLDFIVLVELARSATRTLGEEMDVSNLTRLI